MSVNKYDPSTGQLIRVSGTGEHLTDEMVAHYEPTSTATHAYEEGDQFIYDEKLCTATEDIAIGDTISYAEQWVQKTWSGVNNLVGSGVWTDGTEIYYSRGVEQYVLNKATSTWNGKTWNGVSAFYASDLWTDGVDIYLSRGGGASQVLDKSTSTWGSKTFINPPEALNGEYVWTDGTNIYYSNIDEQYVLNVSNSTWATKSWGGYSDIDGRDIWTDGTDVYYSEGSKQYILNKGTSTWVAKTWTGLTNFYGRHIWSDGTDVYFSEGSNQYVLDKSSSEWTSKTWVGFSNISGEHIWKDGNTIYYSYNNGDYSLAEGNCILSDSLTKQIANKGSNDNFIGTREAWDALTPEEQAKYKTMDFIGDSSGGQGTIVQVPDVTIGTYVYDGTTVYSPTIVRDKAHTTLTGTTSAVDAGAYNFTISLSKIGDIWSDGTLAPKVYYWSVSLNGKTATPVNDIQTWLKCANIDDKAYTTLSEVLADSTTLAALMLNHNAVDYLVRSTSWATDICANQTAMTDIGMDDYCAETLLADDTWFNAIVNSQYIESVLPVKVPTMTSNTTPSGECSASSVYSGDYAAWKAFDGNDSSYWDASANTNQWLAYKFTSEQKIYGVIFTTYPPSPKTCKIQAKISGNWVDALSFIEPSASHTSKYALDDIYTSDEWRFFFSDANGSYPGIKTLQFYGR